MTNRVIHQEYLEAWLRGESIQRCYKGGDWFEFDYTRNCLDVFGNENYEFRITPKVKEVNITDFYAEYDKITTVNFRESFLEDLIAKYLPRESK